MAFSASLRRSARCAGRLRCGARSSVASQNSLRSLRSLRSNNCDESDHEAREYDRLPGLIDELEAEQMVLGALLADGSVYATDPDRAAAAQARRAAIDAELLRALERWEALGSGR